MSTNNKLMKEATNSKEYKVASGKYYSYVYTCWIDTKPFRNWKLYRKTQHK